MKGQQAAHPGEINWKGWKRILTRTYEEVKVDHLSILSAGVAFYYALSLFPFILAIVSIYGLFSDPEEVRQHIMQIGFLMPEAAREVITTYLNEFVTSSSVALSWGLVASVLAALWSTARGMKALMEGYNIAYDEEESRGVIKYNFVAFMLTLVVLLFGFLAMFALIGLPAIFAMMNLGNQVTSIISTVRWPVLGLLFIGLIAVLSRYAPSREDPKWRWVTVGAVLTLVLWLIISYGFSLYIGNFGNYDKTYGSLSGIIILMLWLYFTAYVVLLGAELNAEVEQETLKDSTTGPSKPMGSRGAVKADTYPK